MFSIPVFTSLNQSSLKGTENRNFKWRYIDRVACPIHNRTLKCVVWSGMNHVKRLILISNLGIFEFELEYLIPSSNSLKLP